MRPGYETGNTPFYMKFPREQYYKDHQYAMIKNLIVINNVGSQFKVQFVLALNDNIRHFPCTICKK